MLKNRDRISAVQMFILIVSTINAIEVIILPRELASSVGQDGWMVLIGGHLLSSVAVFFIVKLGLLYPDETIVEYAPKILGRFIGIPLVLVIVAYGVLISARIVREFADFIQLILPQTPIEAIIITMLLVVVYVARHGIEPIARTVEILFPIFIGILGLLVLVAMLQADFSNLLPVFQTSIKKLAMESINTSFGLEGQEIMIMLLPFMAVPQRAYRAVYGALACNLVLRVTLFVVTIGLFGIPLVKTLVWPVEELSRSLTISGTVIGRFDSVFTALWVTVAFTSILVFYYIASLTLSRVMKFREPSITLFPLLPFIFIASLIPESIAATEELSNYISFAWGLYTFTVPPMLLLVSYIRGTHRNKNKTKNKNEGRLQEG